MEGAQSRNMSVCVFRASASFVPFVGLSSHVTDNKVNVEDRSSKGSLTPPPGLSPFIHKGGFLHKQTSNPMVDTLSSEVFPENNFVIRTSPSLHTTSKSLQHARRTNNQQQIRSLNVPPRSTLEIDRGFDFQNPDYQAAFSNNDFEDKITSLSARLDSKPLSPQPRKFLPQPHPQSHKKQLIYSPDHVKLKDRDSESDTGRQSYKFRANKAVLTRDEESKRKDEDQLKNDKDRSPNNSSQIKDTSSDNMSMSTGDTSETNAKSETLLDTEIKASIFVPMLQSQEMLQAEHLPSRIQRLTNQIAHVDLAVKNHEMQRHERRSLQIRLENQLKKSIITSLFRGRGLFRALGDLFAENTENMNQKSTLSAVDSCANHRVSANYNGVLTIIDPLLQMSILLLKSDCHQVSKLLNKCREDRRMRLRNILSKLSLEDLLSNIQQARTELLLHEENVERSRVVLRSEDENLTKHTSFQWPNCSDSGTFNLSEIPQMPSNCPASLVKIREQIFSEVRAIEDKTHCLKQIQLDSKEAKAELTASQDKIEMLRKEMKLLSVDYHKILESRGSFSDCKTYKEQVVSRANDSDITSKNNNSMSKKNLTSRLVRLLYRYRQDEKQQLQDKCEALAAASKKLSKLHEHLRQVELPQVLDEIRLSVNKRYTNELSNIRTNTENIQRRQIEMQKHGRQINDAISSQQIKKDILEGHVQDTKTIPSKFDADHGFSYIPTLQPSNSTKIEDAVEECRRRVQNHWGIAAEDEEGIGKKETDLDGITSKLTPKASTVHAYSWLLDMARKHMTITPRVCDLVSKYKTNLYQSTQQHATLKTLSRRRESVVSQMMLIRKVCSDPWAGHSQNKLYLPNTLRFKLSQFRPSTPLCDRRAQLLAVKDLLHSTWNELKKTLKTLTVELVDRIKEYQLATRTIYVVNAHDVANSKMESSSVSDKDPLPFRHKQSDTDILSGLGVSQKRMHSLSTEPYIEIVEREAMVLLHEQLQINTWLQNVLDKLPASKSKRNFRKSVQPVKGRYNRQPKLQPSRRSTIAGTRPQRKQERPPSKAKPHKLHAPVIHKTLQKRIMNALNVSSSIISANEK